MSGQAPSFGEQLRSYRERAGLTREALAERAQLTASGIAALERGRRQRPYPDTLRRLAAALGLSTDERTAFGSRAESRIAPVSEPAAVHDAPNARSNLPAARTSLIGREEAIAALVALVPAQPGRLVTLTGIGGCGKTRLALAVADRVRDAFPDGVWLVELAPLADPALVPQAVTAALHHSDLAGVPPLDRLVAAIQERRLLLVLDNCEHLVAACAALAERLLSACLGVCILATSREPLQLTGEHVWRVPPLVLPDRDGAGSLDALASTPSVRLFVERARAVDADFRLTAQNAAVVAEVCARLGGLPLALELAAAQVRVLAMGQIRERLDDSLRLLTGSSRAAPTRQQTLRGALDWSYDLLSAPEQALFRRLASFVGTFDLAAAEAVCAAADLAGDAILALLTQLVDKSLVVVERNADAARFRMLEPVRQYAAQRGASDEVEAVRARHAAYYLALAEQAAPALHGPEQLVWLGRLEHELSNLRAALNRTERLADGAALLRFTIALAPFWEGHSHLAEGKQWLQRALDRSQRGGETAALRARAMHAAGRLATLQTDLADASACLQESLRLARQQHNRPLIADALAWLGVVLVNQGALQRGIRLHETSLALARADGNRAGIAFALLNLGVGLRFHGELDRSAQVLAESLAHYRDLGDLRLRAMACTMLGFTLFERGDLTRAAALLREGLVGHKAVGDRAFVVFSLMDLAGVQAAEGHARRAAQLLGAMAALREELAAPLSTISQRTYAPIGAAVRSRLGEAGFAAAWTSGRALPFDAAVALALEGPEQASAGTARALPAPPTLEPTLAIPFTPGGAPPGVGAREPLTAREREVACLLARGCTDREIARRLAISVRTVGVHVHHAIAKLGVRSRWQVADWAREHGLAEVEASW